MIRLAYSKAVDAVATALQDLDEALDASSVLTVMEYRVLAMEILAPAIPGSQRVAA